MSSETAECLKCHSEISVKAEKCPECEYEPRSEGYYSRLFFLIGGLLLTGTIVGAVVGLPMIYIGYKGQKRSENMMPTETPPDETGG